MFNENEFLTDEEQEQQTEKADWKIDSDQAAEWALMKIKEAEIELDKWTRYYRGMMEKANNNYIHTVTFMEQKLAEYFKTVPHKETKTQSKYELPSGTLMLKKPKAVWTYDEKKLLDWAKENGISDCIKVTEKVSWADIKKRLTEDSNGVVCDSETGLVCDAVKSTLSEPEFVAKTN